VTGKLAHQCKQKGGIDTYHKVLLTSAIVCFIEITMSHVSVKIDLMLCLGATSLIITNNDIEGLWQQCGVALFEKGCECLCSSLLWTFSSWRIGWSKNATILLAALVSVSFIGVTPSIVVQYASRPSRRFRHTTDLIANALQSLS
jgi:hypothetical protein